MPVLRIPLQSIHRPDEGLIDVAALGKQLGHEQCGKLNVVIVADCLQIVKASLGISPAFFNQVELEAKQGPHECEAGGLLAQLLPFVDLALVGHLVLGIDRIVGPFPPAPLEVDPGFGSTNAASGVEPVEQVLGFAMIAERE